MLCSLVTRYQAKLQQNLAALAAAADQEPGGGTALPPAAALLEQPLLQAQVR